ncbi:MAG: alpha/beta hydrolase [Deltaproteobacteria bacterium]|nr:alpha/beta hydrolase [Deltaproteobacteria bacterium]
MNRTTNLFILWCSFLVFGLPLRAATVKKYVRLPNGHVLYVEHEQNTSNPRTLVPLNGLTYDVSKWNSFIENLGNSRNAINILRYDMQGMGNTLQNSLRYWPWGIWPQIGPITLEAQAEDLKLLLTKLNIEQPIIVGLSYGGGVALNFAARYPDDYEKLILQAPLTEPMRNQDQSIRQMVEQYRSFFPLLDNDKLYDLFLSWFVYTAYPIAEPSLVQPRMGGSQPMFEQLPVWFRLQATFEMAKPVRYWNANRIVHTLRPGTLHLMDAIDDRYIDSKAMDNFWNSLPAEVGQSRIRLRHCGHKLPESAPQFTAEWVRLILNNDPRLTAGRVFTADPRNGIARSNEMEIQLAAGQARDLPVTNLTSLNGVSNPCVLGMLKHYAQSPD